jgi:DNA-binding PadR family transcriptional regulator
VDKPLTTTSYAVLGLLAVRPWTTYELAKQVQRSLGWFWPRAERKLYDEPKALVAAGLATSRDERTGRRPRTIYEITPAGRRALRDWLGEPAAPPSLEFEAMVKVFFADCGTLTQLRRTLEAVEDEARGRVTELQEMIRGSAPEGYEFERRGPVNALGLRFHLDHEAQRARWAAWARAQIEQWRSPIDAGEWDWREALDAPADVGDQRPASAATTGAKASRSRTVT